MSGTIEMKLNTLFIEVIEDEKNLIIAESYKLYDKSKKYRDSIERKFELILLLKS